MLFRSNTFTEMNFNRFDFSDGNEIVGSMFAKCEMQLANFKGLCRMETLGELMAVLDTCTEAQRRRFLLYALDGLTLAEIGTVCGCSKVSVYESIDAVRKKFLKFFANYPNE